MADSSSEEKTEKPSAQKLRKAREEGQLPRSKDMGLAASLFAAFVVISSSFPWYADFVRGLPSGETGKIVSSYRPYIALGDIRSFLPRFLADGLQAAAQQFERKIPGFVQEGLLLGAETRTSCPLRILRGENFCAPLDGLYPAGEGAGYAGGILSSAVDGIKVAEAIIRRYRP